MKRIILLGASGSIGTQSIDVIKEHPDELCLVGAGVGKNVEYLKVLLEEFDLKYAYAINPQPELEKKYPFTKFFYGEEGLANIVLEKEYDLFENALVGFSGFIPTINAINNHKDIALANKETLVAGGDLVNEALRENGVKLYPIDSEHSAIAQSLQGNNREDVRRLILTASGGSFRNLSREELENVTLEQALNHPNWSMGAKITIDSATMMNKGFEIMEAHHLFNIPYDKIDVLIHYESIIHSMVEYKDNTVMAQLSNPDMRLPIQYAIDYPDCEPSETAHVNFAKLGKLTFAEPDTIAFPLLALAREALRRGGVVPCAMNAANEVAVGAFLDGKIGFTDIYKVVTYVTEHFESAEASSLGVIINADKEARRRAKDILKL